MAISKFSSFSDGLDSNQRSREHFIAQIDARTIACGFPMWKESGSSPAILMSLPEGSALFSRDCQALCWELTTT